MCNKKTVLFIYHENVFSSCIVAIHFLGSLAGRYEINVGKPVDFYKTNSLTQSAYSIQYFDI